MTADFVTPTVASVVRDQLQCTGDSTPSGVSGAARWPGSDRSRAVFVRAIKSPSGTRREASHGVEQAQRVAVDMELEQPELLLDGATAAGRRRGDHA